MGIFAIQKDGRRGFRAAAVVAAMVLAAGSSGCGGAGQVPPPIMPEVLPTTVPDDLPRTDDGPLAVVAADRLLYLVGLDAADPGDGFVLTFGGEWVESLGPRPIIAFARALKVYHSDGALVVLALPEVRVPKIELNGARVAAWKESQPPALGKSLLSVASVDGPHIALSTGGDHGVKRGDQYLVLSAAHGAERLGARVVASLRVTKTPDNPQATVIAETTGELGTVQPGQWALFVGAGLDRPALTCRVEVAPTIGGSPELQRELIDGIAGAAADHPLWKLEVAPIDETVDPLDPRFGAQLAGLEPVDTPRLLIGSTILEVDGARHLVVNYANTGITVAHGMVAATPEQGIDLGDPAALSPASLAPLLTNIAAAVMTHRAENGLAILTLEQALRRGGWDGAGRWHARDQLAMRWAETGALRESLRIVDQDIAYAEQRGDQDGVINAVGTLMPLYEDLGDLDRSLVEARRFYKLRSELGDGPFTDRAKRAYIELLFKTKHFVEAQEEFKALTQRCEPTLTEAKASYLTEGAETQVLTGSCVNDLYFLALTGTWNAVPTTDSRQFYLGQAQDLSKLLGASSLASVRLLQGVDSIKGEDFDGAEIALREARRLFETEHRAGGVGRVESLNFSLEMARGDRQAAFDASMHGADLFSRAHNIHEMASLYSMAVRLYVNIPPQDLAVAAYVRAADATLTEALNLQYAINDRAAAAETLYVGGHFFLRAKPGLAAALFAESITLAAETTRFDIAALAHVGLALEAKIRGDNVVYNQHLEAAKDFARLTGDPQLLQNIIRVESGDFDPRQTL